MDKNIAILVTKRLNVIDPILALWVGKPLQIGTLYTVTERGNFRFIANILGSEIDSDKVWFSRQHHQPSQKRAVALDDTLMDTLGVNWRARNGFFKTFGRTI